MNGAAPPDPDRAPIFVVGTGRSGTTLLRLMLNAHPRIYLTHEASFYLLPRGPVKRPSAAQWLEHYRTSMSYAFLRIPRARLEAETPPGFSSLPPAAAYLAIMRAKAALCGKPRFGDKTPNHTLHVGSILRDFPDARVVHIVRDPRGAVASLDRMPWATGSTALNAYYCDKQIRALRPFANRIHELRLEDLLADPEGTLRPLLSFLGEEWSDAVLDHEHHTLEDDVPPLPWFQSARRNPGRRAAEPLWKKQLSPPWIRIVESMNRLTMTTYGYEPAELVPEPSRPARLRARLAELGEVARSLSRLGRVLKLSRKRQYPPTEEFMKALLDLNPRAWHHYPDFVMPEVPAVD